MKTHGVDDPGKRATAIYQWLSVVLQVVMAVGLMLSAYERQWLNALLVGLILVLTLLPRVLKQRFQVLIPAELEVLVIVFIFASLFLGEIRGYYARLWWWDLVLHIFSGLLLGMFGFLLVYVLNHEKRIDLYMTPLFVALFAFTFAVAMGALWEVFEFAIDTGFGLSMQKSGLVDTMTDLIVDVVGAFVMAGFGYLYLRRQVPPLVLEWIERLVVWRPGTLRGRGNG